MDRFRQKAKNEKPKHHDKAKHQVLMADLKTIKENLKIKEILKTVKINSSMRIKAPRGSKVMSNKDLSETNEHDSNEEVAFPGGSPSDTDAQSDPKSETDSLTKIDTEQTLDNNSDIEQKLSTECSIDYSKDIEESIQSIDDVINNLTEELNGLETKDSVDNDGPNDEPKKLDSRKTGEYNEKETIKDDFDYKSKYNSHETIPRIQVQTDTLSCLPTINSLDKRTRKLSLDHTMLSRRPSLSLSEMNLNSVGKSPLERKSSFFRKKMDNFFKNTSEIFKRQSLSKASELPGLPRGPLSCSLQSLHDPTDRSDQFLTPSSSQEMRGANGSVSSLNSTSTMAGSSSSYAGGDLSTGTRTGQDLDSLTGSQPIASASQPLGEWSESVDSLNEAYIQEQMLNSRAISMSSGLDSAKGVKRRPSSLANRVTWLASEGLTNYIRRMIQDEKSREVQACHSFNDFSTLPDRVKADARGRRLSYQRAVSGEDPVRNLSGVASLRRRRNIPEQNKGLNDLEYLLAEYSRNGVPQLKEFSLAPIGENAYAYLQWAETPNTLEEHYEWKRLHPNEESRQAVIRELVTTEVDYVRHLMCIVEVYMAAAHALQDGGWMLEVDTARLFSNMPDVLNASLIFWEAAFCPMLEHAFQNSTIFNVELMHPGFNRFRDIFHPYERYLGEHTQALVYLRSLASDAEFMIYHNWCHDQNASNRLQLSDMLVKPMQRITKYNLILSRIITYTESEPERTSLQAMEMLTKNFTSEINRSIRQKEEIEGVYALGEVIEAYDIEIKDEELEKFFRQYSSLNLQAPMLNCYSHVSRFIIYEGDLRYKDNIKEIDARAILFTDMLLICKKVNVKGSHFLYKLARPKFMVDKMIRDNVMNKNMEITAMRIVMLDEVGSAYTGFILTEIAGSKEQGSQVLKMWDYKFKEGKLTYDLSVWHAKNPSSEFTDGDFDSSSDYASTMPSLLTHGKPTSDDINIERDARERVAVMHHRTMGASTDYDYSQVSMQTESFDGEPSGASGARTHHSVRYPIHRASTGGSSRNSSFQHSTSAASHDEPQPGPSTSRNIYRAGSSVEHIIPPLHPNEDVTSITVNVLSESESETMVPDELMPLPTHRPVSRGPVLRQHTLMVQPPGGPMSLVHSLPDLTLDPSLRAERRDSPSPQSASEKLYQSHHETLYRNRLAGRHASHYLKPNHMGTSYPPLSSVRASLKRGLAFSYSIKNPRLSKMGHVYSQSQAQSEGGPSTSARPSGNSRPSSLAQGPRGAAPEPQSTGGGVTPPHPVR